MYEIEVINLATDETKFIFGSSIMGAYKRAGLSPAVWSILHLDFVD